MPNLKLIFVTQKSKLVLRKLDAFQLKILNHVFNYFCTFYMQISISNSSDIIMLLTYNCSTTHVVPAFLHKFSFTFYKLSNETLLERQTPTNHTPKLMLQFLLVDRLKINRDLCALCRCCCVVLQYATYM